MKMEIHIAMTVEMAYAWAMSIMHIMIVCGVRWAHSMAESEKYHNWHNDWLLIYDLITPQRNDMNIWDEWIENAFAPGVWVREREREREIANVPSEMATSCRERAPANWWYAFFLPRGCTVSAYSLWFCCCCLSLALYSNCLPSVAISFFYFRDCGGHFDSENAVR